jgi:hypothetical protein
MGVSADEAVLLNQLGEQSTIISFHQNSLNVATITRLSKTCSDAQHQWMYI